MKRRSDNIYTGFRVVSLYPIAPKPEGLTNQRPSWIAAQWSLGDAVVGELFTASLSEEVFDSDNDLNDLRFSLLNGPEWLSIDNQGRLTGIPSSTDRGIHEVMLRVSDPDGAYSDTEFPVTIDVDVQQDTREPTFVSASTSTDGIKVLLTYSDALSSTTAGTTDFAVTTNGSANTVTAVDISGFTVELTLNDIVQSDQTVTVAYTDPSSSNDSNAIQDGR